jgi:hypothetical protein
MPHSVIRIDRGPEVDGPLPTSGKRHGVFRYSCVDHPSVEGFSRQPLLDACRQLKLILGPTADRAGLFREGRHTPDLTCSVEWGAAHTVDETKTAFVKYKPWAGLNREAELAVTEGSNVVVA